MKMRDDDDDDEDEGCSRIVELESTKKNKCVETAEVFHSICCILLKLP